MVTVQEIHERSGRAMAALTGRRLRHAGTTRNDSARDAGLSVAELLVAMVLLGILGATLAGFSHHLTQTTAHGVTRTDVHGKQMDASTLLSRDVTDATTITKAETLEVVLNLVRHGVCETHDYKIAASTLTLTTTWFEGTDCNGANRVTSKTFVKDLAAGAGFKYYSDVETDLVPPIDDLGGVKRIGWTLDAQPLGFDQPISWNSAAYFTGYGDQTGSGTSAVQATAPILTVVTGVAEGKDPPALSWSDTNPAGYVTTWALFRSANPEGTTGTDPARSTWQQVGPSFPAAITSFTDTTLPAGYTAQYVLRPTLSDGTLGPTSNQAVTGLRPSVITSLVVTGGNASIKLTWTKRAIGATGYDIYRDGKLAASLGDVDTFTDGPSAYGWVANPADPGNLGYGHTHTYTVTAQNRWESLLTVGSQNGRVSLGDAATFAYPRGGVRLTSNTDGAFTTPAAPQLAVAANTSWGFDLTWTPAGWVGSGPTSKAADGAATATWKLDRDPGPNSTPSGAWTSLFAGRAASQPAFTDTPGEGVDASQWRHYRASSCNTWGCSPVSVVASALQRPSKPASCTATKTGVTTKQEQVVITPAAATIPNSGYDVQGGTGADTGVPTNEGTQPVTSRVIDRLADGTTHSFATRAQNASLANGGYSDITNCSGATDSLTASTPLWGSTTRKVTASFSAGLGTAQSIALNGSAQGGTSGAWDGLADNSGYTIVATNTDGDNTVSSSVTAFTALLTQPGCSVSGGGTAPNGSITVSGSGSNGTIQLAAAGGGYTSTTSKTVGGLAVGTWSGTARSTDGVNYSSTKNCGSVTVNPGILGNPGPGYDSSDVCNSWMGPGWTALDAAWVDGGNAGSGYIISVPVPVNQFAVGPSLYGAYVSGGAGGNDLRCGFYREHYVKDGAGNLVPLAQASWWDSAMWSQGTGGAT